MRKQVNTIDKIKKEATFKMSGVMLLYIANILRERQIAIFRLMAEATLDGDLSKAEELGDTALANEIVGQSVMDIIEGILGKEDFESFVDGTLKLDDVELFPTSGTLN